jgi:glutamate 5-kinase
VTVPDTATSERADIAAAPRVVVKVGSSSLTTPDGEIDGDRIGALAAALAARRQGGGQVVLVSSGAIASGLAPLGLPRRPRDLATQQAAASVGQGLLIARYTAAFARHGIRTGQVLLSADDLMRRTHYRNAQRTLDRLLELGVLPVVNENDTVATDEIRFGDNDRLAALVAHVTRAGALILLSDVDGLYDGDPRRGEAQRITEVRDRADLEGIRLGRGLKASQGTQDNARAQGNARVQGIGGMATKVEAAMIASAAGIPTVVADAASAATALGGGPAGTYFAAARGRRPATRLLWLKHAAVAHGSLRLDLGAVEAVVKRRASLRPAGITGVEGTFDAGDPVNLRDENDTIVARGLVNYDATEIPGLMGRSTRWLASKLGPEYEREVVHRDDLVIVLAVLARGDAPRGLVVVVAAAAAVAAAGAAVLQAVEQAAGRPGAGLGHAAEHADQRVLGPVPRVLVGLGRVPDLLADRGAAVGVPARVVAAQDAVVLAVGGPVVQLGEPDHRERVRLALELQELQDAVPQVGYGVVLMRLLAERVRVQLGQLRAAGQLHQHPAGGVQVLPGQQPGPVTGQLGLAEPLLQAPDDGAQADIADRHPGDSRRQLDQEQEHGAVDRVPGQDVPDLVTDHRPEFLGVEQLHHAAVDHDERLVPAQRHRVHDRRLQDIALGHLGQVQDVRSVPDHLVDVRELALGDPNSARQVRQPEGPLVEQAEQLPQ